MSAPAPGLAPAPERAVKVRLADTAVAAACVSLIFSLLLVVSPDYFPHLIIESWFTSRLTAGLMLFAILFNCALYVGIARLRSAGTNSLALLVLAMSTAVTVLMFSLFVPGGVLVRQWSARLRVQEDVLFLVYFAVVGAIFFPFLIIRFTEARKK